MEDFWPNFNELTPDVNNSLIIIKDHADALPQRTNYKVKALFSKTQYKKVSTGTKANLLSGLSDAFVEYRVVEVQNSELENKRDANTLFSDEEYKFVVYNDFYRFTVFKLRYNIVYPVTIDLDDDIAKELSWDSSVQINNDAELKALMKTVVNSRKLKAIIMHIMAKDDPVANSDKK